MQEIIAIILFVLSMIYVARKFARQFYHVETDIKCSHCTINPNQKKSIPLITIKK